MSVVDKHIKIMGIVVSILFSGSLFALVPLQTLKVMVTPESSDVNVGFSISGPGASGIEATTEGNNLSLMAPKNGFTQNPIQVHVFANSEQVCELSFSCKSVFDKECFNETVSIKNKLPGNDSYQYISWNDTTNEINVPIRLKEKDTSEYYCAME